MSTRANIIIKDDHDKLYFYRHSDGYPEVTLKSLEKFLELVKNGSLRNNVSQCAGHLILMGAKEYDTLKNWAVDHGADETILNDWKVGAYEPTTGIHGDIEYLYIIDLIKLTIEVIKKNFDEY